MTAPDALLLIASHCAHCPALLESLAHLVTGGVIGSLRVVNLEARPEVAAEHGVRAVPWLRLGPFEFDGLVGREELATWARRSDDADALADYFHLQLKEGRLARVIALVDRDPERLAALLPIVADPDASLNVRIGAGAVFEEYTDAPPLARLVPRLGQMTLHPDARVRVDACHYLGLSGNPQARPFLTDRLGDGDPSVVDIAGDALSRLDKPA